MWEQQYTKPNATNERIRASVRVDLNDVDNFVRFHVSTNEVPISKERTGKDIVVDWFMMDGFDS